MGTPTWADAQPWLYQRLHTGWGLLLLAPAFYGLTISFAVAVIVARCWRNAAASNGARARVINTPAWLTTSTSISTGEATQRLGFLDGLRGTAALCVFFAHAGVALADRTGTISSIVFNGAHILGQFGVIVFFLCSGFIIPISL